MGKPDGFLEYARAEDPVTEPLKRIEGYEEFHLPSSPEERRRQGARCMNCGVPFCQSCIRLGGAVTGCPLHNLIPEWNDEIFRGNYSHALSRLLKTASFPEFTGRVCPALCEKACINGKYGEAVTVRENELYIIEHAFASGYIRPRIPEVRSESRVAVVGSGPAGLACADMLNQRGHRVTVYEKSDRAGGLLMYGIPNMKLDKSVVARRTALMEAEGIRFVLGTKVGTAGPEDAARGVQVIAPQDLLAEYDAVILCCGCEVPRPLQAWETAKAAGGTHGVYNAVDYLTANTKHLLDGSDEISAAGKHVVIVGGGDTGNDCLATAIRQGAVSAVQLVRKKEAPAERPADNPWPEWPRVRRTDYGQQEAIALWGQDPRIYETGVKSLRFDDSGRLTGVETVRVGRKDGRYVELEGTEALLEAELLIAASGFSGCDPQTAEAFGLPLIGGCAVTKPGSHATGIDRVFAAGDMRRGPSLVVWAIAEGRDCAAEADEYLVGYHTLEKLL